MIQLRWGELLSLCLIPSFSASSSLLVLVRGDVVLIGDPNIVVPRGFLGRRLVCGWRRCTILLSLRYLSSGWLLEGAILLHWYATILRAGHAKWHSSQSPPTGP
jgi:hypothetical protein